MLTFVCIALHLITAVMVLLAAYHLVLDPSRPVNLRHVTELAPLWRFCWFVWCTCALARFFFFAALSQRLESYLRLLFGIALILFLLGVLADTTGAYFATYRLTAFAKEAVETNEAHRNLLGDAIAASFRASTLCVQITGQAMYALSGLLLSLALWRTRSFPRFLLLSLLLLCTLSGGVAALTACRRSLHGAYVLAGLTACYAAWIFLARVLWPGFRDPAGEAGA